MLGVSGSRKIDWIIFFLPPLLKNLLFTKNQKLKCPNSSSFNGFLREGNKRIFLGRCLLLEFYKTSWQFLQENGVVWPQSQQLMGELLKRGRQEKNPSSPQLFTVTLRNWKSKKFDKWLPLRKDKIEEKQNHLCPLWPQAAQQQKVNCACDGLFSMYLSYCLSCSSRSSVCCVWGTAFHVLSPLSMCISEVVRLPPILGQPYIFRTSTFYTFISFLQSVHIKFPYFGLFDTVIFL